MDEQTAQTARAAARKLAGDLGRKLPGEVDSELRMPARPIRQDYHPDAISNASLIVGAALLAWAAYRDLMEKAAPPARHVIERRVRVELRATETQALPRQKDHVIVVVVDEMLAAAGAE